MQLETLIGKEGKKREYDIQNADYIEILNNQKKYKKEVKNDI